MPDVPNDVFFATIPELNTRIETADSQFSASAPIVDASLTEGVK